MDAPTTILTLIIGLLIRLALPILITILVVYALRQLDERWKREAQAVHLPVVQAHNIGC